MFLLGWLSTVAMLLVPFALFLIIGFITNNWSNEDE